MQVPHDSVVLVADGRKLLFLRNEGDDVHPNLTVEHAEERANPANRDQKTDAAGGSSSTQSGAGAPLPPAQAFIGRGRRNSRAIVIDIVKLSCNRRRDSPWET